MQVTFTIIRYPVIFVPFAFISMALQHIVLLLNKKIIFYKLLGCGKKGTFVKVPDLQQWGIITVHNSEFVVEPSLAESKFLLKELYGSFIKNWIRFFRCETFTILLEPIECHGLWDGKEVFGNLREKSMHEGPVAILTRATIRLTKLKYFWQHIASVAAKLKSAKGYITSISIGEVPWIKQATFSIWENKEAMSAFAYGLKEHTEVIKKTREQQWYSEELFARFRILGYRGTINGVDPLIGKL